MSQSIIDCLQIVHIKNRQCKFGFFQSEHFIHFCSGFQISGAVFNPGQ